MTDLRLPVDDLMFVVRAGIVSVQDDHLLVVSGDHLRFQFSPGGVSVGEDARQAAAREWREETGAECGSLRLVGVLEPFFELGGQSWRALGFSFQKTWAGPPLSFTAVADAQGERLEWLPLEEVASAPLYPASLGEFSGVPEGEIRHLVVRGLS